MSLSHEQRMTIANVKNHGATSQRKAYNELDRMSMRWGGRWVLFYVVLDGKVYWPVLGGTAVANVGEALGWEKVAVREVNYDA